MPQIVVDVPEPVYDRLAGQAARAGKSLESLLAGFAVLLSDGDRGGNEPSLADRRDAIRNLREYVASLATLRSVGFVDDSREAIYEESGE